MTLLYFFVHVPAVKDAYQDGKSSCKSTIDTTYVIGDTVIQFNDRFITVTETKEVIKSGKAVTSSIDSLVISGKDTIKVDAAVTILNDMAHWILKVNHKDYETLRIDTVKISYPEYITETIIEKDWLFTGLSYIAGVISAVLIFFFAN
jgi:VIT1/CCC1 family predicted Fe2+/Mn2+ transporter